MASREITDWFRAKSTVVVSPGPTFTSAVMVAYPMMAART